MTPAHFAHTVTEGRWIPYDHLLLLNRRLVDVAAGRIKRLMVFMPPRHGKSELVSRYFPAWYLGTFPDRRIILASYEADFASSWGRKARNLLEEFGWALFGVEVSSDSSAASRWDIAGHEGGMVTAGVRGPITGKGANVAIIDDPVKNDQEAMSPIYREGAWDWYRATFSTRLQDEGAIVLVMTRWHVDDLAERLLKKQEEGGEKWETVNLPALAESDDPLGRGPGEPLCPELFTRGTLEAIKDRLGSFWWSALYQQSPINREGGMFQRGWFEIVEQAPSRMRRVRYWDLAATEPKKGSDPDWTVGALVGAKDGIYYICDMRRTRSTPKAVEDLIKQTAELDGRDIDIWMEQEPGSSGVNTIDHYARRVLKGFSFRGRRATGPKALRANPVSAAAEAGNVKLVRGAWNADFLDEVEVFPNGAHDDQADAVSGGFEALTKPRPQVVVV